MRHWLILFCLPLLALDNSVTHRNFNGTGLGEARHSSSTLQTARPITDHRIFARGEIAAYPKPNGITPWQSDVKSRWRDSSATRACSAATVHVSGQVLMTCNGHGFRNTETVVLAGNSTLNGTYQAVVLSVDTFVLKGKVYSNPGTLTGVTATGPTYGSVKEAFISYKADIPANGSAVVDFVNDTIPCSSGNQAACDSASLDQSGMLAFNGAAWNVKIEATAAATTYGVDARTMLGAGQWSYRLRGPVVTQVVVEDMTAGRSFGWHLLSTVMTVDAGTQYKSLNPRYVLTFYAGWAGVKTESILENSWSSRWQDQVYDVAVKTGAALGATAYSKLAHRHYAGQRWRKIFWDGTAPGDVMVDLNFDYLIYSKAIMPYVRNAPDNRGIDCYYTNRSCADDTNWNWPVPWTMSDKGDIGGSATWGNAANMFDGDEEAGILQGFDVLRLMGSDSRMDDVLFGFGMYDTSVAVAGGGGTSAGVGSAPYHERDTVDTPTFCQYSCIAAPTTSSRGRMVTIDSYPGYRYIHATGVGDGAGAPVWNFDSSHAWDTTYAPWLITGDLFSLEEVQWWAEFHMAWVNPSLGSYNRRYNWGIIPQRTELRSAAWATRAIAHAAFSATDNTPEEEYFRNKLENNIAVQEGFFGITNGFFGPGYPCATTYAPTFNTSTWTQAGYNNGNNEDCNRWYFGVLRVGSGDPARWDDPEFPPYKNTLALPSSGNSPANAADGALNMGRALSQEGSIQTAYWSTVMALVRRLGFAFVEPLIQANYKTVVDLSAHPASNPANMINYRIPGKVATSVIAVTSCAAGNPTVCSAPAHGLGGAASVGTCCSSWGALNRPLNSGGAYLVATPTDADHVSINADTTGLGAWVGTDIFTLGTFPAISARSLTEYRLAFANPNTVINNTVLPYPDDLSGQYQMYQRATAVLAADMGITTTITRDGYGGRRTGNRAYHWWQGNSPWLGRLDIQKRWAFAPAAILNVVVIPATTSVVLQWDDVDGGASTVSVSATSFSTSSDSGDSAVTGGHRRKRITVSGLASGTRYYYRITHGADRVLGTFTTN
jgi:hypothetical protein